MVFYFAFNSASSKDLMRFTMCEIALLRSSHFAVKLSRLARASSSFLFSTNRSFKSYNSH